MSKMLKEHNILDYRGFNYSMGWLHGVPHPYLGGGYCIIDTSMPLLREELVDPKSIGSCTGLYDKRGRLIYQGDILRGGGLSDMGVVVYDMALASYMVHDLGDGSLVPKRPLADVYRHAMIVGNEYERGLAAQRRP